MKDLKYYNASHIALSLSNLRYRNRTDSPVIPVLDIVEDATTAQEFCYHLNALNLIEHYEIDRVTNTYVRLVSEDRLGNKHYLEASFD